MKTFIQNANDYKVYGRLNSSATDRSRITKCIGREYQEKKEVLYTH